MKTTGNTILVTGGGSGIGRGLAVALARAGNDVIVAGRRAEPLGETVAAHPGMARLILDVADPASIAQAAATLAAEHPALDMVIHNAGVMIAEDLATDPYDPADAETMVATNLLGPIRLTAALLPQLRGRPSATIMTVSSGLAFVPLAKTPTYSATKAAIHSWSQSLRAPLADTGIEVIELAPPAVATDLMPGHAENPHSMPLADYIEEVMALLRADPAAHEILVERVRPLRFAERDGEHARRFGMLNGG